MKVTSEGKRSNLERLKKHSCPEDFPPLLGNELEEVVAEEYPLIHELKHSLLDSGAESALMSGSGSSVYGIFDDPARAAEVAGQWRSRDYWVHEGRTLDFNPIMSGLSTR
jgi:4-diphosphocytidyl-2-C-methyl-D-erythritol kinase